MLNKNFLIVTLLILMGGGILYWYLIQSSAPIPETIKFQKYKNDKLGIQFNYPKKYELHESGADNEQRRKYMIVIAEPMQPGQMEGPPAITFEFFQHNFGQQSIEDWIINDDNSNFKLSNGNITPLPFKGKPAFLYQWSGLYEGESIVFKHRDYIVMASVTHITPQDQLIQDFQDLIEILTLY